MKQAALTCLIALSAVCVCEAQEPSLPPGLGNSQKAEPALPPGLSELSTKERELGTTREAGSLPIVFHGFWEVRGGLRTQNDPVQPRDAILGETRLQLETDYAWDAVTLEYTGDFLFDGVQEEVEFDLRRLRLSGSPAETVDIQVGRQVLTWGTGDLVFINDLFPKDWQAFFIGRDEEYLKAPSNSLKVSWFPTAFNIDLVYTPQFEPDRYVTGERISFWNVPQVMRTGRYAEISADEPDDVFEDDEFALRVYRTFGSVETALYAYSGFWKSPAGGNPVSGQVIFPALSVYGGSVRGTIGGGIGNIEAGYYDSRDDRSGDDPNVDNSEFRFLAGYEREMAREFTVGVQYFLQRIIHFSAYENALPAPQRTRERYRHLITARLTKLLMNQDLTLSLFTFYSPSDEDAYFRPKASYKMTDAWEFSVGGNVFAGASERTFFGQFEDNSNLFASARYAF